MSWTSQKQHLRLQSVAGISCHSSVAEDRIRQCVMWHHQWLQQETNCMWNKLSAGYQARRWFCAFLGRVVSWYPVTVQAVDVRYVWWLFTRWYVWHWRRRRVAAVQKGFLFNCDSVKILLVVFYLMQTQHSVLVLIFRVDNDYFCLAVSLHWNVYKFC